MEGEVRRARFGFGTAWGAATAGAILLWVAVAALAPRAERGHVVRVDPAGGTLTLEALLPSGAERRTFALPRNIGVQRFDQQLSLADLRPGQWVELGVREIARTGPTVTSIRIIAESHRTEAGRDSEATKEDEGQGKSQS